MARKMLNEDNQPKYFWGEVVNTKCHIFKSVLLGLRTKKSHISQMNSGMKGNQTSIMLRPLVANFFTLNITRPTSKI